MGSRIATERRHSRNSLPVVLLLLALLVGGSLAAIGSGALPQGASSSGHSAGLHPQVIAATTIYLNRSQTKAGSASGPYYVNEFVELNNSSTLTRIPDTLTAISGCRWVSVVNLTENNLTASPFTKIEYANVTAANASSTVLAGPATTSFKACAGNQYWVNYKLWTFGIYDFSFTGLAANGTVTVTYGDWPGTTIAPSAQSIKADKFAAISLKISSNLTFTVAFPLVVNGSTTCIDFSQVCSFPQYTFVSASLVSGTTVNKTGTIVFGKGYAALASGTYSNWTVGYTNSTVSDNTATGAFFALVGGFWTNDVVAFADLWILFGLLVVIVLAIAVAREHGRGRSRHEHR